MAKEDIPSGDAFARQVRSDKRREHSHASLKGTIKLQ